MIFFPTSVANGIDKFWIRTRHDPVWAIGACTAATGFVAVGNRIFQLARIWSAECTGGHEKHTALMAYAEKHGYTIVKSALNYFPTCNLQLAGLCGGAAIAALVGYGLAKRSYNAGPLSITNKQCNHRLVTYRDGLAVDSIAVTKKVSFKVI